MTNANPHQYYNKNVLAPMVKIGTLPARLLNLRYGADLVYTEEIIDWKILKAKRVVNDALGTIDFYDESEGVVVFRTCAEEKSRVIFQVGTSCPERALQVLKKVENDVAGFDVNMGCPKDFSLKGGMGAALLREPEKVKAILTNLVKESKIPVTCKIRVLPTLERTIELVKMIESCGVSALAVHGRTKDERQQHMNRNDYLKAIAGELKIPVIANGGSREIYTYEDISKFRTATGCSSVMIARAAEWNSSIFRKEGKVEIHDVIKEYLKLAVKYQNAFPNTKYNIQNMLREQQESPLGKTFLASNIMEDLCKIWNLEDLMLANPVKLGLPSSSSDSNSNLINGPSDSKRLKLEETATPDNTIVPDCVFIRGHYPDPARLPKSVVLRWYTKNGFGNSPLYSTNCVDKKFQTTVDVGGQKFKTNVWEKNKRYSEQAAALAFIRYMKLDNDES